MPYISGCSEDMGDNWRDEERDRAPKHCQQARRVGHVLQSDSASYTEFSSLILIVAPSQWLRMEEMQCQSPGLPHTPLPSTTLSCILGLPCITSMCPVSTLAC